MKATRVSRGGEYYYLHNNHLSICVDCDFRNTIDDNRYEIGNYFHTKEDAEAMAEKIRKVLKGADVIEMPSEDEMLAEIPIIDDPCDYLGPGRRLGWRECFEWLKSKIVR